MSECLGLRAERGGNMTKKKYFLPTAREVGLWGNGKREKGLFGQYSDKKKSLEKIFVQYDSGQLPSEKRTFPR